MFAGIYPTGIVYADKHREQSGDYKRLAYLNFATLELEIEEDCPPELVLRIKEDARVIQDKRGNHFQVSTCGQTILLGSALTS